MQTKIILLNSKSNYFIPIKNKIISEGITNDVVFADTYEMGMSKLPESSSCIVIVDSLLVDKNHKSIVDGPAKFAIECKKKFPNCFTILYAPTFFDLNQRLFHSVIDSLQPHSFEKLIKSIKELSS